MWKFQRLYVRTARQLRRVDSIKRSPLFIHFDESYVGATSIRAYRRQHQFVERCDDLIDDSQRAWYLVLMSQRSVAQWLHETWCGMWCLRVMKELYILILFVSYSLTFHCFINVWIKSKQYVKFTCARQFCLKSVKTWPKVIKRSQCCIKNNGHIIAGWDDHP